MARTHDKPEEIVSKLRQVEVLNGQGMPIAQAAREVGTTEQTYYRWLCHVNQEKHMSDWRRRAMPAG